MPASDAISSAQAPAALTMMRERQGFVAGAHGPAAAGALERMHRGVVQDPAIAALEQAQVPVVQGVHVDIGGVGFEQGAGNIVLAQHRAQDARLGGARPAGLRARCRAARRTRAMTRNCRVVAMYRQPRGPRQRALGERRRRCEKKGPAGARQGANRGVAVDFSEQRRGTSGRVIAGAILAFDQDHAAAFRPDAPRPTRRQCRLR